MSYEKAQMQYVFSKLLSQLKKLELGINIGKENTYFNTKLFLIIAIFDKPARAAALNIVNSTGFFGCLVCRQKGMSIKTKSIFYIHKPNNLNNYII